MEITGSLRSILARKGPEVWTIQPGATVFDALQLMADRDVGALAVVDGGAVAGIFSERDYARKVALLGKSSKETLIWEVMTSPPVCVGPDGRVDDCMRLMTDKRTRHVLVMAAGALAGMVSIGDLVNWTISAQQEAIGQLSSYISGDYSS
jgi:CBS domain-containing protein